MQFLLETLPLLLNPNSRSVSGLDRLFSSLLFGEIYPFKTLVELVSIRHTCDGERTEAADATCPSDCLCACDPTLVICRKSKPFPAFDHFIYENPRTWKSSGLRGFPGSSLLSNLLMTEFFFGIPSSNLLTGIFQPQKTAAWFEDSMFSARNRQVMPEASMTLDAISYNATISSCAKGAQWQTALQLLDTMLSVEAGRCRKNQKDYSPERYSARADVGLLCAESGNL